MDDQQADPIQESENLDTPTDGASDSASVVINLENLIKNNIDSLDKLRQEMKKHQELYADAFENNPTYREHSERVKEANKAKASVHEQIANQPSVIQTAHKIKDMRIDIKEREASLSDYLQEFQRLTGANEIEGHDGQLHEIITIAKLIKRALKSAK